MYKLSENASITLYFRMDMMSAKLQKAVIDEAFGFSYSGLFCHVSKCFSMKSYWTKSALAFISHYYQQCCASLHKHRLFYCTKYPLFSEYTYLLPFFYSNNMYNFSSIQNSLYALLQQLLQIFLSPRKVT